MKKRRGLGLMALVTLTIVVALSVTGCGKGAQEPQGGGRSAGQVWLSGAGASFPYPLYSKWIEEYKKVRPDLVVDYQSIGSGGGIKGITEKTIDFAGSDAPMSDEEMSRVPGKVVHIPSVIGAVAVTYNLPGNPALRLDGDSVAGIFLGKIKKWNDPRLVALNAGVTLPDKEIAVIHRSDGSGTTYCFTDYLASVSPAWKQGPGRGKSVEWPAGIGAKGNEGVAGQVSQIEGSIGYVELAYAVKNNLACAALKNRNGSFVEPTIASTTAAGAGAAPVMPEDMRVSIVNAAGADAYPIATFTYLIVYQEQPDRVKGKAMAEFLWWAVHDGQQYAAELLYASLPANLVELLETKIKSITYQGQPLFQP